MSLQLIPASASHPPSSCSTGISDLDQLIGGLKEGDLIVLGGRPNTGKTVMAMGMTNHLALSHRRAVGVFSLSNSKERWAHDARRWAIDAQERAHLEVAFMEGRRILIDDTSLLDVQQISARARRLKLNFDIGAIVVDYLQVLVDPTTGEPSAVNAPTQLKALAVELGITVIALTSLKRLPLEERADRRPLLEDLPAPIAAELLERADAVLLFYRDEIYEPGSAAAGLAEVQVIQPKLNRQSRMTLELRAPGRFTSLTG